MQISNIISYKYTIFTVYTDYLRIERRKDGTM